MEQFEILAEGKQPDDLDGLFAVNSANYNELKHALEREFRQHGAPEVTKMNFDRIKYDPRNGKGSFRIVLNINFTFGCEDLLVPKTGQTSEWTFVADGKKITFNSSPFAESRSTADEF
jgi:hypothetical protein